MNKFFKIQLPINILVLFFLLKKALAVCPLCVVAVAGGIEISRWLKIDDFITGIWIGGLIISLIYWTLNFLDKKNINFKAKSGLIILGWYLLVFGGIYMSNIQSTNILPYLNKINLGIIIGSFAFWFGIELDIFLRSKNNGRQYILFQKVVIPIAILLILSIIFFILLK